jgi:hypothetical protein
MNDEGRRNNAPATNDNRRLQITAPAAGERQSLPPWVIELTLEEGVRVYSTAVTEAEHVRTVDWVNSHLDRRRLLGLAVEVQNKAKAP